MTCVEITTGPTHRGTIHELTPSPSSSPHAGVTYIPVCPCGDYLGQYSSQWAAQKVFAEHQAIMADVKEIRIFFRQ